MIVATKYKCQECSEVFIPDGSCGSKRCPSCKSTNVLTNKGSKRKEVNTQKVTKSTRVNRTTHIRL